jgi:hypothetical protein
VLGYVLIDVLAQVHSLSIPDIQHGDILSHFNLAKPRERALVGRNADYIT